MHSKIYLVLFTYFYSQYLVLFTMVFRNNIEIV